MRMYQDNRMNVYIKKNYIFLIILFLIIAVGFIIRINNIRTYNSWWADDGGAHIIYVEKLMQTHQLPTTEETYVAWHEPGYYILLALWGELGALMGIETLNWLEISNLVIHGFFIASVLLLAWELTRNKKILLILATIFSFLFIGVKLSGYITNELLVQAMMIYLVYLFVRWHLDQEKQKRYVVWWAVLLGFACMIKLTASIVCIAALLTWILTYIPKKKKEYFKYILITVAIVLAINTPWLRYKEKHFDSGFSINFYESSPKQSIFTSNGWAYILTLNYKIFVDKPYWFSQPESFVSILIADTFGDYYNLFNNVDRINTLPNNEKIQTSNGRFTTPALWNSNLWAIRVGGMLTLLWGIGYAGFIISLMRKKIFPPRDIFILLLSVGGLMALLYNNLRYPYVHSGTLKANFIYFIYPLITLCAYQWWFSKIGSVKGQYILIVLPLIGYLISVSNIILIR